jgi:hypothetical protein
MFITQFELDGMAASFNDHCELIALNKSLNNPFKFEDNMF